MRSFRLGAAFLFALIIFMLSSCMEPPRGTSSHAGAGNTDVVGDSAADAPNDPAVTPGESDGTAPETDNGESPGTDSGTVDDPAAAPGESDGTTSDPDKNEDTKTEPDTDDGFATEQPDTDAHVHIFTGATCTEAGKCECGATDAALGHDFAEASCTAPSTCKRCGTTSGKALGHSYAGATCTESGKCTRCGTKGSPLGHNFAAATCTAPGTCTRCKITSGSPLGHSYSGGKCKRCGDTNGPLTPEEAKLFKNKLTDEENAQALAVARELAKQILEEYPDDSDYFYRIAMAASLVSDEYYKGVHKESGNYYSQAYGVFIKRESSCAGCSRALGLVLSCMGYEWTHVNENLWTHQWVTLTINGETIWADGQVGWAGYGSHPLA